MTLATQLDSESLMLALRQRWLSAFTQLNDGEDWPPGCRMRTEGMMEALLLLQPDSRERQITAMDECYREAFGSRLDEAFGKDWQLFYPFPQIPAMMRRAPVYPSTSD
ncbi:MAG: hypothetical protein V7742_18270 [Halioglobus sp.]